MNQEHQPLSPGIDPVEGLRNGIRNVRREQIVDAAVAVIAERGLQSLSLSAIEERLSCEMSSRCPCAVAQALGAPRIVKVLAKDGLCDHHLAEPKAKG